MKLPLIRGEYKYNYEKPKDKKKSKDNLIYSEKKKSASKENRKKNKLNRQD